MACYNFVKIVQIILGYFCVHTNYQCFLKLESISSGWELIFHIIVAAFFISTIILLLTSLTTGITDERVHNPAAAICIFSVSICLLITINGDRENILSKEFGEQSFMDKSITLIGNSINKVTGTSLVDKFTNKYKRNGVYDEYFLAALAGLLNSLFYLCSCSSKPKSNNQVIVMSDLPQNQAHV